jgi:hypothetical protein
MSVGALILDISGNNAHDQRSNGTPWIPPGVAVSNMNKGMHARPLTNIKELSGIGNVGVFKPVVVGRWR